MPATPIAATESSAGNPNMAPLIPMKTISEDIASVLLCHAFASRIDERYDFGTRIV
ncbi:MAG: hypothetical protein ACJAVI_004889 [Candidatus Azotimanducaceae bacterium]|jgi:hypothetical protein